MSRLRLLPYRDLRKVAEAADFGWVQREGSYNAFRSAEGMMCPDRREVLLHNTFRSAEVMTVMIPDHGHQVIVRPLLRRIIRDLGLTLEAYNQLVEAL